MASYAPVFTDINPKFIQTNLTELGCELACWKKSLNTARAEIDNAFKCLPSTVPFIDDVSEAWDRASKNLDSSAKKLESESVSYAEFKKHFPHEPMDTLCDECWYFQGGVERFIEIAKGCGQSAKDTSLHFQRITKLHCAQAVPAAAPVGVPAQAVPAAVPGEMDIIKIHTLALAMEENRKAMEEMLKAMKDLRTPNPTHEAMGTNVLADHVVAEMPSASVAASAETLVSVTLADLISLKFELFERWNAATNQDCCTTVNAQVNEIHSFLDAVRCGDMIRLNDPVPGGTCTFCNETGDDVRKWHKIARAFLAQRTMT